MVAVASDCWRSVGQWLWATRRRRVRRGEAGGAGDAGLCRRVALGGAGGECEANGSGHGPRISMEGQKLANSRAHHELVSKLAGPNATCFHIVNERNKKKKESKCPRLDPQIHMSHSEGAEVTRRRCRRSPAAQASLPGSEDLLREILLRLQPQPSSLLRASAVCKQWRRLVTDPKLHRRFRAHHGKPPLLGVFHGRGNAFRSVLDPPDRIPPERFDLRRQTGIMKADVLGCRHGRVLLMDSPRQKLTVCDPITGKCHHIDAPPVFKGLYAYGSVICAAADQDPCTAAATRAGPFKVVLMSLYGNKYIYDDEEYEDDSSPIACIYSSKTDLWGKLILTTDRCDLDQTNPGVLVGNALYWSSKCMRATIASVYSYGTCDIIEFHLDTQNLAVIKGPPCLNASLKHQIIEADDGAVGLAMFSHGRLEMWQRRKVNSHGGATWLLHKTVEMHTVLGLPPQVEGWMTGMVILGYDDEDKGSIFVHFGTNVYMVQLVSMQSRKLYKSDCAYNFHPFTSFYAPAIREGDEADMLHDP